MSAYYRHKNNVYYTVSKYYEHGSLSKEAFKRRLHYIHEIIRGKMTTFEAADWLFAVEDIPEMDATTPDEVKRRVKLHRDDLKRMMENLNFHMYKGKIQKDMRRK